MSFEDDSKFKNELQSIGYDDDENYSNNSHDDLKQILAPISETKNEAQTTESNITESDFLNTNKPQNASSSNNSTKVLKIVPIYSTILSGI